MVGFMDSFLLPAGITITLLWEVLVTVDQTLVVGYPDQNESIIG
jgi:hypothetical protein